MESGPGRPARSQCDYGGSPVTRFLNMPTAVGEVLSGATRSIAITYAAYGRNVRAFPLTLIILALSQSSSVYEFAKGLL